jgi:glycosyltransferase involved in cell wall biosynthesis
LRFLIVGRDCADEILRLAAFSGISVQADAANLEEFYNQATLAIVPLRAGGGTRIKIIEAALLGVPVVSTRVGAEGLSFVDGRDIWLADDAKGMTDEILFALDNPDLARDLASRAQALAQAEYSHDKVSNELACIWKGLLAKGNE